MTQLLKTSRILLAERFLIKISRPEPIQIGMTESTIHNQDCLPIGFPEATLKKDLSTSSLFGSGTVGMGGREEGKAASKRSINMKITPVNNWSSIPLRNWSPSGVKHEIQSYSNQEAGELGYFIQVSPCLKAAPRILSSAPPACCVRPAEQVWWPESPGAKQGSH